MKKNGISFDELQELLEDIGFREATGGTKLMRFEHSRTGTVLLFRKHDLKGKVNDRDMHVVRRQLVDNGLIEASAFSHFLQRVSA